MLGLILRYLRPYRPLLILLAVLQLVSVIASLYLPSLNARVIDEGVVLADTALILRIGSWMLAVSALQVVATYAVTYLGSRSSSAMGRDLRAAVFTRVAQFSSQEVTRFGAPTLISRGTNDVTQIQTLVNVGLTMLVSAPIMMIGGVVMALREDVGLSWLLVVAVPLLALIIGSVTRRMIPQFRLMQACVDLVNRILREQITGIRVVRAFVREDLETDRFEDANARYTATALAVGRLMAFAMPAVMLVFNTSTVAVLWFGAARVSNGQMQVGALTAFMAYLMQILMAVMMATFISMMIPRAAVSAGRIDEVLSTESSVRPSDHPVPLVTGSPLRFDNVSFAYPGAEHPVLHDLTFEARPGTTTAIVGSTGSGKTTLVNLVPRLFDVTAGAVRIGDVDVRDADPEHLWARIGLVPQRPYLFSGTVASNLRYGRPQASDEELWEALRIARADDFVADMPRGLDAPIAQGGTNVSGGQRQRLAIARVVVRQPEIYLFDDAFSALDVATDAQLRAALRPITRDSIVIVVAQRISTILQADQIVVLEEGRLVGLGRHEDLLVTCPTYAEIVESQRTLEVAR